MTDKPEPRIMLDNGETMSVRELAQRLWNEPIDVTRLVGGEVKDLMQAGDLTDSVSIKNELDKGDTQ